MTRGTRKEMPRIKRRTTPGSPFLCHLGLKEEKIAPGEYPFTIPIIENGLDLTFDTPITFLVGENGSGKSTILEGLAWALGYSAQGGNRTTGREGRSTVLVRAVGPRGAS